jgi:hypothetical protein
VRPWFTSSPNGHFDDWQAAYDSIAAHVQRNPAALGPQYAAVEKARRNAPIHTSGGVQVASDTIRGLDAHLRAAMAAYRD